MATKNAKNIRVGLLVAGSLIVLMTFLFFIGSEQKVFARKNEYNVQLENVSGLAEGNPVRMSGVTIGVIHDIFLPHDYPREWALDENRSWNDPKMAWDLNVPVPPGSAVKYHCEYSATTDDCGNADAGCCFTFGGHVETQEHCNIFVYYYPKERDVGCF